MRVGARTVTGKTSELIALLADGRSRSVPEIHSVIGPCRLNSRAAEARKRLKKRTGRKLICTHTPGLTGPAAYSYVIPGGPLTQRELSVLTIRSSRCVSGPPAHSAPVLSDHSFSGSDEVSDTGAEQLSLLVAA